MKNPAGLTRRELLKTGTKLGSLALTGAFFGCGDNDSRDLRISKNIFGPRPGPQLSLAELMPKLPGGGPRPNIIVILTDDMGFGDIGCYGSRAIKTPRLDRMAAEGARFTDAYCSSPLCSPSRAGLLTGRYPLRSGLTAALMPGKFSFNDYILEPIGHFLSSFGIFDIHNEKNLVNGLPHSEITLAQALKLTGYATGLIGKWHLGDFSHDMQYHPHNYGFDYFCGFPHSNDMKHFSFWREKDELISHIGLDQARYTGLHTDESINFMKSAGDKPFFLCLFHKDAHQPCIPSEKFRNSSQAGPHGDTVQEVDYNTGRIFDYLRQSGRDADTLVIFTSDNGAWFDGSNGIFRGAKGQSFEGGYRVPLIARWPGHIPAGQTLRQPVMNIDFFPTLIGLAGLSLPGDRVIDGRDIYPLLAGQSQSEPHEALYYFHYTDIEAVRCGDWKYIHDINSYTWPLVLDKKDTLLGKIGNQGYASTPMLYNLAADPGERYNLVKRDPMRAGEMFEKMEAFRKEFAANPRGWK